MKKTNLHIQKYLMNPKNSKWKEIHIKSDYNTLSKAKDKDRFLKVIR